MGLPSSATYLGLFLIVLLGEAGLPMLAPVELALIAAGIAVAKETASLSAVVAIVLTADLIGTLILFLLVRASSSTRSLPGRLGRLQAFAERTATRIGATSPLRVALGRAIPFLRVPTAGAAALAGLSIPAFAAAALAGGVIWTTIFVGGAALATEYPL